MRWSSVLSVGVLVLCFGAPSGVARAEAPVAASDPSPKRLLMHYMPWYETPAVRGRWGAHWTGHEGQHDPDQTDRRGLPDIWSNYHPLIGPYDSADPDVLECQLLQMKLAGVDGVIVDWYGIADAADYPPIHDATQALFAASESVGLSFAVCYEDRTIEQTIREGKLDQANVAEHLAETFAWMNEHWFDAAHYVRVNGRPLVLNFGPIVVKDSQVWQQAMAPLQPRPAFFALHHLWRDTGADGGFSWVHYDAWQPDHDPAHVVERLHDTYARIADESDRIITSATPGFHDVYAQPHPYLAHRGGQTLRDSLTAALHGPWSVVQLVTWNDYGEGTMFEPTHEFGYLFLEILQDAARQQHGEGFAFTPADLRLPARLLERRQAAETPAEQLDAIAQLLKKGQCQAARQALDGLASPRR